MPTARQLTALPTTCDILDSDGKGVAIAYRLTSGRWNFHDLEKDWWQESESPLEVAHLVEVYIEIRRSRGQTERARKST
jgi:hypothetical protein